MSETQAYIWPVCLYFYKGRNDTPLVAQDLVGAGRPLPAADWMAQARSAAAAHAGRRLKPRKPASNAITACWKQQL